MAFFPNVLQTFIDGYKISLYNDYYKSRIFVHVLSFKVRHHQRKTYQMNFKMHIICKIAASIIQGVC